MLWPCDMLGRSSRDRQRAVHGGRPPPADRGRRSTAGTIHPTGPLEWEAIHFPSSSLRPLRNGKTLFYERIWPMARCNARPKTRQIRNEEVRKHGLLSASGNCCEVLAVDRFGHGSLIVVKHGRYRDVRVRSSVPEAPRI